MMTNPMHRTSETSTLPSAMSSTMPFWPWRREWDLPSTSRFARSLGLDLKQQENMTEGCQRDICGSLSAAHLRRCTARHENNSQPQATGTQSSGYSGKRHTDKHLGRQLGQILLRLRLQRKRKKLWTTKTVQRRQESFAFFSRGGCFESAELLHSRLPLQAPQKDKVQHMPNLRPKAAHVRAK